MRHFFIFVLFSLTLLVQAKNFNQFCDATNFERDCSEEFLTALKETSESGDTLLFSAQDKFFINSVNTAGLNLSGIKIQGATIKTNKLWLRDISDLEISDSVIIGDPTNFTSQETALVALGGHTGISQNIKFLNSKVEKSAEDLLVVTKAQYIEISNSRFHYPGLAERLHDAETQDPRPRGSNLLFANVHDLVVENNDIRHARKVGIYVHDGSQTSTNITIKNNYLNLINTALPSKRYGVLGGNGIYLDQTINLINVLIEGNEIFNYRTGGIRINGQALTVQNNYFNFAKNNGCSNIPEKENVHVAGTAIKGHYINGATIAFNCVRNTLTAMHLHAWGEMNNLSIYENSIVDTNMGIVLENSGDNSITHAGVYNNEIYGFNLYAVAFLNQSTGVGNYIVGNTISNGNPKRDTHRFGFKPKTFNGPALKILNQSNFTLQNNWIYGLAVSRNWSHVLLEDITQSRLFHNTIISPQFNRFGGFQLLNNVDRTQLFDNQQVNVGN